MWTDDHIRFSVWDEHFLVARNNDEVAPFRIASPMQKRTDCFH